MFSAFLEDMALPGGKEYHCNFIYNYASRKDEETRDTELSLNFVKFLVGRLKSWGYTKCYYYHENGKLGEDVFDQNFVSASKSILTLVIITEEFTKNHWVHYIGKTVFKTKVDAKEDNRSEVIPIVLGAARVPVELKANAEVWFSADENKWQDYEQELKKLKMTFDGKVPVTRTERDTPSQDPGDGILRSEVGHMIVNPQPSMQGTSSITLDMNERQMESLSSSVAAVHVSSTLPLLPGSQATSSQASQDHDTSSSSSGTDKEDGAASNTYHFGNTCGSNVVTGPNSRNSIMNINSGEHRVQIPSASKNISSEREGEDQRKGHVMISYSTSQKIKARWIRKQLKTNRFSVWIDEVDMGEKLLDSIAEAIETAHVVLVCFSDAYKESDWCKREAVYAKKKLIPLKMENVKLDGWLGLLLADYLYYDFSGDSPLEEVMEKLLQNLASHYGKDLKEPEIEPYDSFIVSQKKRQDLPRT